MDKEIEIRNKLRKQITEEYGNVFYTYSTHWNIVDRLKCKYKRIKIEQIVLTALSAGGFLSSLVAGIPWLSWIGGSTSAVSLGLNLYLLNFNVEERIKKHTDAANDLWDIKSAFKSLLVDFEVLSISQIQARRDELLGSISRVNKQYQGTDEKAFIKAQREIKKYTYDEGELERLFNIETNKNV